MDCWKRFDRKVVLYFTGNKDTRVPGMERELERVGLDDAERQWTSPNPFDDILLKIAKHEPQMNEARMSNMMAHYRAIATAYHLGCRSVLVMEDDIRFFNDLNRVSDYVGNLPEDYDVAKFDSMYKVDDGNGVTPAVMERWRDGRKKNEFWSEFDSLYSTGCCAYSRTGMKKIMFCVEAVETAKNIGQLRNIDHFLDRKILGSDMRMYFSRENVCIQRRFECETGYEEVAKRYSNMGVDFCSYSPQ